HLYLAPKAQTLRLVAKVNRSSLLLERRFICRTPAEGLSGLGGLLGLRGIRGIGSVKPLNLRKYQSARAHQILPL
ncbi:hypothetical protein, partial [Streptococcus pneumoniae]|uniref:hypothetical protein n=1 Tax=Streptococcus pneumoniae TaxID=1313 RepID=UPI001E372EDA